MLLIRRLWLLPAFVVSAFFYYLYFHSTDSFHPAPQSHPYDQYNQAALVHWKKHPEKHPVASLTPHPSGPVKQIPRIQFDFSTRPETAAEKKTRENRRDAVKKSFQHSWNGYKKYAWRQDEVAPLSGIGRSSFGGWGATLVDAMDTLWIMGLEKDFEECVLAVSQIDFTINTEEMLNVFETTIRYLGGLLAAYDISKEKYGSLLVKAQELGEILYSAFDTFNRMPICRWQWLKTAMGGELEPSESTLLAELGSLTLEFTRLTQLTGNDQYFDAVQRIANEMNKAQDTTPIPGLWPTVVNAKELSWGYPHYTFGGMADSTYEYLPKQYLMLGGRNKEYITMYEKAIEAGKKHLFFRPMVPGGEDILFSGNTGPSAIREDGKNELTLEPQGQHLTCFAGGMVGISAKIFNRPDDLDVARRLVDGCVWAYNAQPSGLMPETFHMVPCQQGVTAPEANKCDWSETTYYEHVAQRHGNSLDTKELSTVERGKYWAKKKMLVLGFTEQRDNRYILRPEAIESIFIMYRITGDTKYQEIAWKMFESIEKATRTKIAHAAVHDVRLEHPKQDDRMESFWLAETLKYFYLIFSEPDLVSLDEWVLNTEAHPLRRPS